MNYLIILFNSFLVVSGTTYKQQCKVVTYKNNNNLPRECSFKFETGLGRAYIPVAYYDPASRTCKEAVHGGGGTGCAPFNSIKECRTQCQVKY